MASYGAATFTSAKNKAPRRGPEKGQCLREISDDMPVSQVVMSYLNTHRKPLARENLRFLVSFLMFRNGRAVATQHARNFKSKAYRRRLTARFERHAYGNAEKGMRRLQTPSAASDAEQKRAAACVHHDRRPPPFGNRAPRGARARRLPGRAPRGDAKPAPGGAPATRAGASSAGATSR